MTELPQCRDVFRLVSSYHSEYNYKSGKTGDLDTVKGEIGLV